MTDSSRWTRPIEKLRDKSARRDERRDERRQQRMNWSKARQLSRAQGSAQGRPQFGTRGQPEESRAAILRAAIEEFAQYGIDGARTDRIARAARVNKALLYYYFKDKDALYEASLDHVFTGMREQVIPVLESDLPPRRKILEYVSRYFDYIAANPQFPRVVQAEIMRVGMHGSPRMMRIAREYFTPIYARLGDALRQGAERGELRPLDPLDFVPTMVGIVIFYFTTSTTVKALLKVDPLSKERIAERKKFVLEFISAAISL